MGGETRPFCNILSGGVIVNKTTAMPDLLQLLNKLDTAMVYFIGSLRLLIFLIGLFWIFKAVLNLYQATVGGASKLLPTNAQPTVAGSFLQVFIASLLIAFSYNMMPAALVGAIFNENMSNIQLYSVASYNPNPSGQEFQDMLYRFMKNVFYAVGFLAIWRGLSTWYNKAQGTSNEPAKKVVIWLIMGGLCFFPDFLNGLLVSITGFNIFSMLFNK